VNRGRATPELYRALAACETAAGSLGRAEGLLMAALEAQPGRPDLVLPWVDLLLARGAADEAMTALDTLDQAAAASGPAVELRTRALLAAGRAVAALDCVREHARSGDASVRARLLLVETLQANGREAEAASVLEELFALDPVPASVRLFEARARFREGDEGAIDALRDLLRDGGLEPRQAFQARQMLAEALHRAGRFPEAAKAYDAVAQRRAEILFIDRELQSGSAEAPESALQESVVAAWPKEPPPGGRAQPVFVIAWPGSGQERVLPALGAHPEVDLVLDFGAAQAGRRAQVNRPRGATALGALDEAQAHLSRRNYWKTLKKAGFTPGDGLTLDSMWLTVESLPTIARLFPGAHVLVLGREPRDLAVYWMRAGYRDLDAMARMYRRQLALLDRCRELLPLEFVELDYDALEKEPGAALRAVVKALGLPWDPAVLAQFEKVPMPVDVRPGEWRDYAPRQAGDAGGGNATRTTH
jgi:tetratricopeptide (TPR) repeat protein